MAPAPASRAEPASHNTSGSSTDTKAGASSPEANQSQSAISEILKSFSDLKSSFVFPDKLDFLNSPADSDAVTPKLAYTPNNAPLHQQEHLLTGLLTKLDAVESFGQESIRKARKDAVLLIERELEELDVKKLQKWREQFKEPEAVSTVLSDADTETLDITQNLSLETRVEADPASIPLPHDDDLDIHSPTDSSVASSDSIVTPIAQESNESPVTVDGEAGKREIAQDSSPVPTDKSTEPRTDSDL
ncbi:hypothetical protein BN14_05095 [Rhizoctonia solani AG-1 IB]|uniref:BAG domain-containing protein n=1 Tax=Thanatephorus cucumeris (strain AG1-IB / isolate 7/3/14) TaxID=1108050 RepID=M5BV02_THACB|nr:hypothetical protein BN14_05095 [Rhizoctonia solani AG-1 IB]